MDSTSSWARTHPIDATPTWAPPGHCCARECCNLRAEAEAWAGGRSNPAKQRVRPRNRGAVAVIFTGAALKEGPGVYGFSRWAGGGANDATLIIRPAHSCPRGRKSYRLRTLAARWRVVCFRVPSSPRIHSFMAGTTCLLQDCGRADGEEGLDQRVDHARRAARRGRAARRAGRPPPRSSAPGASPRGCRGTRRPASPRTPSRRG